MLHVVHSVPMSASTTPEGGDFLRKGLMLLVSFILYCNLGEEFIHGKVESTTIASSLQRAHSVNSFGSNSARTMHMLPCLLDCTGQ